MKANKKQTGIIWAVALILTGIVILLASLEVITVTKNLYLYSALAIVGVVFHVACFVNKPKRYNYLVPGGMLIIIAALLLACEYSDIFVFDDLWAVIILAVAFGMLEQRVFSKGSQGSWATIIVISIIGFFFLIQSNLDFGIAFGILLIIIGILIVVRMARRLSKAEAKSEEKPKDQSAPEPNEEPEPQVDEFDEL